MSLKESYNNLGLWAAALSGVISEMQPQIMATIDDTSEIPEVEPTKGQKAGICFRQVEKKFQEVQGAIEDVERDIKEESKE